MSPTERYPAGNGRGNPPPRGPVADPDGADGGDRGKAMVAGGRLVAFGTVNKPAPRSPGGAAAPPPGRSGDGPTDPPDPSIYGQATAFPPAAGGPAARPGAPGGPSYPPAPNGGAYPPVPNGGAYPPAPNGGPNGEPFADPATFPPMPAGGLTKQAASRSEPGGYPADGAPGVDTHPTTLARWPIDSHGSTTADQPLPAGPRAPGTGAAEWRPSGGSGGSNAGSGGSRSAPGRRPFRRHPLVLIIDVFLLGAILAIGFSIGHVLALPGTDTASARLAEWARDHHLNFAVTYLEKVDYKLNKPKAGGVPAGGIPKAVGVTPAPRATVAPIPHTPAPARVQILAGRALPNEGQWQSVVTSKGLPAVRVAYVRPDSTHTSYLTGLMWLDPKLVAARFHPGYQDPGGGPWSSPTYITPQLRPSVLAAFNGGFRLNGAARGGVYLDGKVAKPLRDGAASLVVYADGHVDVGSWNHDVKLTPQVSAVRQNLDILVAGGQVNATCSDNNSPTWGYTLGNVSYVWRSGFGITRDGGLIYVAGNALSVCSLGQVMVAAGVVKGMELDINPDWTTGFYYTHPTPATTVAHKLSPFQSHDAERYFTTQSRDFFAWYQRP